MRSYGAHEIKANISQSVSSEGESAGADEGNVRSVRTVSRRRFLISAGVVCGAGVLAACAIGYAHSFTGRQGGSGGGSGSDALEEEEHQPFTGLVTRDGATYGYLRDALQKGVANVDGNWRHFDETTGVMTYGIVIAGQTVYISDAQGVLWEPGWHVTDELVGEMQRYWVDSVAHGCALGHFTAGREHYFCMPQGYVLRGKASRGEGMLLADNDGKLAFTEGWLATDVYDGETQIYRIDTCVGTDDKGDQLFGARTGEFTIDGEMYVGRRDTGYLARGIFFQDDLGYRCDEETGAVLDRSYEDWYEEGGSSVDVHNAAGLAKLAVRVATRCIPEEDWLQVGDAWDYTDDVRAQEYLKICEESTLRWGDDGTGYNPAFASCCQAIAMIARATVYPDMRMEGSGIMAEQLRETGLFDEPAFCQSAYDFDDYCEPGDILCRVDGGHIVLYVGNDLVRKRFPTSNANIFEAHYDMKYYPALVRDGLYASYDGGGYYVLRFNGTLADTRHTYFNPWKLLAGDSDWDDQ